MFRYIFELLIFGLIFTLVLGAILIKEFPTVPVLANAEDRVEYTVKISESQQLKAKFERKNSILENVVLDQEEKITIKSVPARKSTSPEKKTKEVSVGDNLNLVTDNCYFSEKTFSKEMLGYFSRPAEGCVSDNYGCLSNTGRNHDGLDIAGNNGSSVKASANGTVFYAKGGCSDDGHFGNDCNGGLGNYVVIKHNISGSRVYTVYAHLKQNLISKNSKVSKNQIIGTMGNSGNSDGTHLHFMIMSDSFEDTYTVGCAKNSKTKCYNPENYF